MHDKSKGTVLRGNICMASQISFFLLLKGKININISMRADEHYMPSDVIP